MAAAGATRGVPWWGRLAVGAAGTGCLVLLGTIVSARWMVVGLFVVYGALGAIACELGRPSVRPALVAKLALTWGLAGLAPALGLRTPAERLVVSTLFLAHCLALAIVRNAATERVAGEERAADPLRTGGLFMGLLATAAAGIPLTLLGYLWTFGTPAANPDRLYVLAFVWGTAGTFGLSGAAYVEPGTSPYRRRRRRGPGEEQAQPGAAAGGTQGAGAPGGAERTQPTATAPPERPAGSDRPAPGA